ncbi:MAG: EamA family transporter [SAR202 cluster bacterium]|nr:MAG: EamA family transporter [SAR202 cluster bacterium]
MWVALLSAGTFGIVTVLDKRLASYNMPSLVAFYMGVMVSLVGYATVAIIITGIPQHLPPDRLISAIVSGLCWGGALAMMFWGYKLEEASRASAIIHTFPVFVAILAVVFLGETLGFGQWIAIFIVVSGAITISLWGASDGRLIRFNKGLPVLLGASLFTALALLTGKYALEELPLWFVYSLRNYGMATIFLFLWRPGAFRQLYIALTNKQTLIVLLLAEFILAPLAVMLNVAAIKLGPVSLVSTVTATRPVFVFIFGSILSISAIKLLDEPLEIKTLAVKLGAIIMIVAGIAALTLL